MLMPFTTLTSGQCLVVDVHTEMYLDDCRGLGNEPPLFMRLKRTPLTAAVSTWEKHSVR